MAVPKRRTSKMKKRLRRSGQRWRAAKFKSCPECGNAVPSHIACPSCGFYRDRQVLSVDAM
ncbi:MAG: 50S ribosomal protein L32 [Verrucomicrobiae bacterium]|nr:50S ribosomal protein L32 [Verrucomicrobiae bacterium]MCP5541271.1 50S ribosomal protein L32 [Akkermansiaceae bacterium]MCP5550936.1 50S ribosomal protein L32 [Akkermansiaceae bacterium]